MLVMVFRFRVFCMGATSRALEDKKGALEWIFLLGLLSIYDLSINDLPFILRTQRHREGINSVSPCLK